MILCEWWSKCDNLTDRATETNSDGIVPICDECADADDIEPEYFVSYKLEYRLVSDVTEAELIQNEINRLLLFKGNKYAIDHLNSKLLLRLGDR